MIEGGEKGSFGLLIMDSIIANFRCEYECHVPIKRFERYEILSQIMMDLDWIGWFCDVSVVMSNKIAANVLDNESGMVIGIKVDPKNPSLVRGGIVPCGGSALDMSSNTRVHLQKLAGQTRSCTIFRNRHAALKNVIDSEETRYFKVSAFGISD